MTEPRPRTEPTVEEGVIWHDVECGAYAADLALWERLAAEHPGPILELGCGTGRVALRLAALGHEVTGVERDPVLAAAAKERAAARSLRFAAVCDRVERIRLGRRFTLIAAPMQLIQVLDSDARREALAAVADHLAPEGIAAIAILDGVPPDAVGGVADAVPDVRERDGWIHSSLPLEIRSDGERLVVRRLRQTVSPEGDLAERTDTVILRVLDAAQLEAEASAAGLRPAGRLAVPATDDHLGSTVVLLEGER